MGGTSINAHADTPQAKTYTPGSYRRLWARPGLRRAAIVPCPFIPLDLGRGVIPFETLQRSRRDPLGP